MRPVTSVIESQAPIQTLRPQPSRRARTPLRTKVQRVSIIIPALDEEPAIGSVLERVARVRSSLRDQGYRFEVLVIDDGSRDGTARIARQHGARVISHPNALGNGAAVKRGIRAAKGDVILLMDADGQHPPERIPELLAGMQTHDLVVGARGGTGHGKHKRWANRIYNGLASWVVGKPIPDLTSGFRAARADVMKRFCYLLPNTFSYPTTITLAFFRAGYAVKYVPIEAAHRDGKSKIKLLKDGSRFFLIIAKIATFFAPLRVFGPLSLFIAGLGVFNYLYTYLTQARFTNTSVVMLILAAMTLGLGLISEQIAALRFQHSEEE